MNDPLGWGVSDPIETRPTGVTTANLVALGQTVWASTVEPKNFLGRWDPTTIRWGCVWPIETCVSATGVNMLNFVPLAQTVRASVQGQKISGMLGPSP